MAGGESGASSSAHIRLADLLAALSLVTDLGMGHPPEEAMRSCLLAASLARRIGLAEQEVADVYYTALLRFVGCTAYAYEEAALFGGDDIVARAGGEKVDFGNPRQLFPFFLFELARDAAPLQRARLLATMLTRGHQVDHDLKTANCEVATSMARRLALTPVVQTSLHQIFERWDGKGVPQELAGEQILLPARVAQIACLAVLFDRIGGPEAAILVVRERAGTSFDPSIAAAFISHSSALLAEIATDDIWQAVLDAEPTPRRLVTEAGLDQMARAFADLADLKSPYTHGHSVGVAALAEAAARRMGLAEARVAAVRRAALFHDLGRASVPNSIWDKRGPLTASEWERVRLHAYHSERILARSPVLAPLAPLAGMHHERQDGSGYHRQATGVTLPMEVRILAAADTFQAMTQERPHRPAHSAAAAADELDAAAARGSLDAEAVQVMLAEVGQSPTRARVTWPAGLSEREVEVLRLIAAGASYREVAGHLVISPRTAAHHVQHIYNKIGVSSRAAAALFAMEHDLLFR